MATYPHWQVRITRFWSDVSGYVFKLAQKAEQVIVFEHPPDEEVKRTHCHCYFLNVNLKYDAMNERLKKEFPVLNGNKDFAISGTAGKAKMAIDLSGAYQYGTKKLALRPVWVKDISPATIEELHESARRHYAKWDNTTLAPSGKAEAVKKPTQYQIVREIAANVLCPEFLQMSESARIKVVREATIETLTSYGVFCGVKKTGEYIECVMRDLGDESFKTALNRYLQNIFYGY